MTDQTPDPTPDETPDGPPPPETPDAPRLSSPEQRELALSEVVRTAEAREIRRQQAKSRATTPARIVAAAVLVVAAIWVWFFPPGFLQTPPAPALTPERQEAGLRFGVALQAERVRAHVDEVRRLPDQLREVRDTLPGMVYDRRTASSFRLWGRSGDLLVDYDSTMPLREFLGDALEQLGGGQ